jgi:hypothetical protein
MNPRIKLLAEQANIHFSRVGILDGDPNGSARMVGYSKMEKFAELIVRDCALTAGIMEYEGRTGIGAQLLDNYGVEE